MYGFKAWELAAMLGAAVGGPLLVWFFGGGQIPECGKAEWEAEVCIY